MTVSNNREEWLIKGVEELNKLITSKTTLTPKTVKVSTGFTGTRGSKNKAIGVCYAASCASDNISQIFIHPEIEDSSRALDILLHELLHAYLPANTGHKGAFKQNALKTGLTGQMTATVASKELEAELADIISRIGEYPHAALKTDSIKKDTTRLIKVECFNCGYVARVSRKWLATGAPICPQDNIEME